MFYISYYLGMCLLGRRRSSYLCRRRGFRNIWCSRLVAACIMNRLCCMTRRLSLSCSRMCLMGRCCSRNRCRRILPSTSGSSICLNTLSTTRNTCCRFHSHQHNTLNYMRIYNSHYKDTAHHSNPSNLDNTLNSHHMTNKDTHINYMQVAQNHKMSP